MTYVKPVVTTNDPDAKNAFVIIELFEPLGTGGSRKARLNVDFSEGANTKAPSLHDTPAHKGFILLWLIKSSNQRPHL